MNKLIILDRDGVINEDSDNYVRSIDEWQPIEGSITAMAALSKAGYIIAVATNQSGLARGYFQPEDLNAMHQKMTDLVMAEGGKIDAIFFCPHGPNDQCLCRKPKPGMIENAIKQFQLLPNNSWVVGDSLRDIQAGQQAGCKTALVKTGKGERTLDVLEKNKTEYRDVSVFSNLKAFAKKILKEGA
ncbi:D-glycero-beta-D-manno-heptose-1,7-bisphosphate 7-phosphatase [Endozoicomonas sp. (ex Bugula neritina AB1)]|nr:D-glycero-beta-D-manno-heptose-1,7-bisphosphate 7-phosphatase [Endozoicomonas sp. (ex Bugula neritina AB1)]